ncbi:superoxide dismutase [Nemania sp. NC0429]|nr:superoxide dismutase [Nemania sp. NC0429]
MRLSNILVPSVMGIGALAQDNVTGKLGDAPVEYSERYLRGLEAMAVLPHTPFFTSGALHDNVKGSVKVSIGAESAGTEFEVTFSNLPKEGGPFTYHLHVEPVDDSGNCTKTLAHLDPFIRGEDPPCNPARPETCQVGDLSGKYGKITSDPFKAKFRDPFTTMEGGPGSFFLNRSVVVHFANKTRITCANFNVTRAPDRDPDSAASKFGGSVFSVALLVAAMAMALTL